MMNFIEALDGIEPPFDGLQSPTYPLDPNLYKPPFYLEVYIFTILFYFF